MAKKKKLKPMDWLTWQYHYGGNNPCRRCDKKWQEHFMEEGNKYPLDRIASTIIICPQGEPHD